MKTKPFLWILLSILLVAPVVADEANADEMSVDDVIAKHIETMGGMEAIKAVQSARMSARIKVQGMDLPMTMTYKRPRRMYIETELQGMKMIQAYDGEKGWSINPMMGSSEPEYMADDQLKQIEAQSDFEGLLVDYKDKGHTVELVGKEDVEGTEAYKLKVTKENGDVVHIFLDTEHFLIFKQQGRMNMQGVEVNTTTHLSDYKKVGDLLMPHATETVIEGSPTTIAITFTAVELNVEVDDEIFAFPGKPEGEESEESGEGEESEEGGE